MQLGVRDKTGWKRMAGCRQKAAAGSVFTCDAGVNDVSTQAWQSCFTKQMPTWSTATLG